MKHAMYYVNFAQAYGEGAYSSCNYNDSTECTTSGGGGTSGGGSNGNGGSGLADTGFTILVVVTIACALIFAALVVRIWRRNHRKAEEVTNGSSERDNSRKRH